MTHRSPLRTMAPSLRSRRRQRGVAALFVTVMLCFAMVLAVAVAQRNVVVEEQRSANEVRAASAFEAAEAGLEWALARINDPSRIGSDCGSGTNQDGVMPGPSGENVSRPLLASQS